MKVGLIRGRHPLPVERYLIEQETVPFDQAHILAHDAMQALAQEHRGDIDLYITGLTRATLGAIAGWMAAKNRVTTCEYTDDIPWTEVLRIWEYNSQTGEYESVISYPARANLHPMLDVNGSYEMVVRVGVGLVDNS